MNEVRVKVCGLTEVPNALACVAAGAAWIGLNFHPASPRAITPGRGAEIASALGDAAEPVGLFVDRPAAEVAAVAARVGLRTLQLHGSEPPESLLELARSSTDRPFRLIKAFRLGDAASVDRMVDYVDRSEQLGVPLHAILIDAFVPGQAGGTGRQIPAEVLDRLPAHPRLILAGGLDPSNVAEVASRVRPWMVDVSSGVESSPGVKDPARVVAFVRAAAGGSDQQRLTHTYASR